MQASPALMDQHLKMNCKGSFLQRDEMIEGSRKIVSLRLLNLKQAMCCKQGAGTIL